MVENARPVVTRRWSADCGVTEWPPIEIADEGEVTGWPLHWRVEDDRDVAIGGGSLRGGRVNTLARLGERGRKVRHDAPVPHPGGASDIWWRTPLTYLLLPAGSVNVPMPFCAMGFAGGNLPFGELDGAPAVERLRLGPLLGHGEFPFFADHLVLCVGYAAAVAFDCPGGDCIDAVDIGMASVGGLGALRHLLDLAGGLLLLSLALAPEVTTSLPGAGDGLLAVALLLL